MIPVWYRVIIISSGDGIRHTVRATYGCRNDGNLLRYLPYQCYTVPVQAHFLFSGSPPLMYLFRQCYDPQRINAAL